MIYLSLSIRLVIIVPIVFQYLKNGHVCMVCCLNFPSVDSLHGDKKRKAFCMYVKKLLFSMRLLYYYVLFYKNI